MRRFCRLSLLASVAGIAAFSQAPAVLFGQAGFDVNSEPSPLVTTPQSPSERVRGALLLLKLSRGDLAKEQIDQILAENLDSAALLALRDEFGTGVFLRFARSKDLGESGGQLLDQISAAARSQTSADGYLDDLLAGMSGNREDASAALREIKRLGPNAVVELVSRAGGEASRELVIERVLSLLGDRAIAPLTDVVAVSANRNERFLAMRVLARTATTDDVATLVAVAADENESNEIRNEAKRGLERLSAHALAFDAAGTLKRTAQELLTGQERIPRDNDDTPLLYGVDKSLPGVGRPLVRLDVDEQSARRILAARALEAALRVDPDDRAALEMAYVLRLQASDSASAETELLRRGPQAADAVLKLALEMEQFDAAVAALDAMALVGRHDAFAAYSAASRALDAPNSAVQFAAARAAVMVEPKAAFENSSRVVEILLRRIAGEPGRKVVVVDPNPRRGGDIGGRLQQIGFTPILTESGREGFRTAASRGDVALAVVHANSINWELTPTVANFEADARTASIPVAIVASTSAKESLRWIRKRYPQLMYLPVISDSAGYRMALGPAIAQMDQSSLAIGPEVRSEAAELLRRIAERDLTDVYSLRNSASTLAKAALDTDPKIVADIAATIAYVDSAESQQVLADLVVGGASSDVRQTAARGLVRHLSRHGSVLSKQQIDRLAESNTDDDRVLQRLVAAAIGLASR